MIPPGDTLARPEAQSEKLSKAVARVARDLELPADWLNSVVARQWDTGLPPGFHERVRWRKLGGLWVGTASRYDLIFLKLFAAADGRTPETVHFQDLVALNPADQELEEARKWIATQDPSEPFIDIVEQVIDHVRKNR